jgi:transcriptional regulator with XRE-family HTH domain
MRTAREASGIRGKQDSFGCVFGQRLVRLRRRKQWSRPVLAQKLGVSRDRLAKWEAGIREPPLQELIALGKLLGVSLDELIVGKRSPGLTPEEQEKLARRLEALQEWLR